MFCVRGTSAFAALQLDGSVVTWGSSAAGRRGDQALGLWSKKAYRSSSTSKCLEGPCLSLCWSYVRYLERLLRFAKGLREEAA